MSKFNIVHGASKINLVLLKTNIEATISQDIDLLANWSNNERRYIVNELLRFALAQEEDFQKHKASAAANPAQPAGSANSSTLRAKRNTEAPPNADSSVLART